MISVALTTYNGEKYLEQQIDSILNQDFDDIELIVSDDASTDQTWALLNEYAKRDNRVKIYRNEKNIGFKANFEKVIKLTSGDYVALCDQDDIWLPSHISTLLSNIGNKMIACGNARLVDTNGIDIGYSLSFQESLDYVPDNDLDKAYTVMYFRSPFQGASMLIDKRFFNIALPIPEGIAYHDAWFSELACFYGGINYTDEILALYRRHDKNVTGKKILRRNKFWYWRNHLRSPNSLKDRIYVAEQILNRVPDLNKEQIIFLNKVIVCFKRKKTLIGRFKNAFFELLHYKKIFSCDKDYIN